MLVNIEDHTPPPPSPTLCREVGKECKDCVSQCASTLAILCPNLEPSAAQSLFFRLYPYAGCASMARTFVREYLSEAEPFIAEVAGLCA